MKGMLRTLPTELTVTIECKWIDSIKNANLDINESTLLFEYPEVYYLDLNLKYKCDCNAGNAKFDKSKKTLTIRLPVVGLTEDSQKVADADYAKFLEHEKERKEELAMLEKSRMDEEAEERGKRKLPKETTRMRTRRMLATTSWVKAACPSLNLLNLINLVRRRSLVILKISTPKVKRTLTRMSIERPKTGIAS